MVMVTVTKDNIRDVIPLALELEGLTESFNFNRLSLVGEGAKLMLPERAQFISFLQQYLETSEQYPHMRLKDNLFNILLHERGMDLFDGCTGYGCGAAFNFITVLSDGEAHACRKFPSPIGNVFEEGIEQVYDSDAAARYRLGCDACRGCAIRTVCGGCLSIAHSFGLDVFRERDPFCFWEPKRTAFSVVKSEISR
jgi:selenobiotic family peptide radical SAM maturase